MASQRKIAANRRNAKRSTGPRSESGKAASRLNSTQFGIWCTAATLCDEDASALADLIRELAESEDPVGPFEERAVQQIGLGLWRLDRIARVEAGVLTAHHFGRLRQDTRDAENRRVLGSDLIPRSDASRDLEFQIDAAQAAHPSTPVGLAYLKDVAGPAALEKLTGYARSIEASIIRWYALLESHQAARGDDEDAALEPEDDGRRRGPGSSSGAPAIDAVFAVVEEDADDTLADSPDDTSDAEEPEDETN